MSISPQTFIFSIPRFPRSHVLLLARTSSAISVPPPKRPSVTNSNHESRPSPFIIFVPLPTFQHFSNHLRVLPTFDPSFGGVFASTVPNWRHLLVPHTKLIKFALDHRLGRRVPTCNLRFSRISRRIASFPACEDDAQISFSKSNLSQSVKEAEEKKGELRARLPGTNRASRKVRGRPGTQLSLLNFLDSGGNQAWICLVNSRRFRV
ncbi:hypothetical protein L596_006912 [Steinernema carpocapsae]|uniref:Uncharacterized protein n=1 Tax=Steinernema carpocapsae TaxID=34508 RepID=A0A4U5P7G7_STECR|nr:hypothetical protein L596_006912 [Steinernema carpocapsae]